METPPEKKGKKRFLNFTEGEKIFLLLLVQKHKDVIDSKDVSAASCTRKKNAWASITKVFNQEPGNTKRETKQLQKLFFNLKEKRKKELASGEANTSFFPPGFGENYLKKSMSDTGDSDEKDNSVDDDFSDDDDNDDDLENTTLPSAVYEPIIKLEPSKRKYKESFESEKTLFDLKMKEAEVRVMIANEQLEEAKIKKETASLVQQYEIKYYEEKIRLLNNMHNGSQMQLQ